MKKIHIKEASRVFEQEISELIRASKRIDNQFNLAIEAILNSKHTTVLSGVGKSGHIAQKISSTLSSTGTPSIFVHPTEAIHGDLGRIQDGCVFIAVSYSGETYELLQVIPFLKIRNIFIISLTGRIDSRLAINSDVVLDISVDREACINNLAPTSSTTVSLVMGDAIAIALMKSRKFTATDFAKYHPGGSLGRRTLSRVCDEMQFAETVTSEKTLKEVIIKMTNSNGVLCVLSGNRLKGIITDGDLRRCLNKSILDFDKISLLTAKDIMTQDPVTIASSAYCNFADELMKTEKVNSLVVHHNGAFFIYKNMNGAKS